MANVASNFITFLISLLVLAVVMAYYMIFTDTAMRLTPYILLSFVPILILFVLCVGVGMILCTMEVFFKDVEYMYEVFCMLLFYATPIFYNVETLHITNRYAQYALMANPLYSIVSMFRDCVLFGRAMNPNHIIYSAVFSVAMLLIGVLVSGEVTITTLGVRGMPLLRFKTGDICYHYTEPCACGRNTIRLSSILGRKGQMIKYKGTTLYPPALFDILDNIPHIKNYIVEVYTNELGTDEILIRIGSENRSEAFAKEIKDLFRSKVRVAPSINFESAEYIAKIQMPPMSRKIVKFIDLR